MIVLVDNFDSFLHNLARYLRRLGQEVIVLRNDAPDLLRLIQSQATAIVISPGPCDPSAAGQCLEVVERFSGQLPILGVCLGHQVIYQAFGGRIIRARAPVHGRSTMISLEPSTLFNSIPSPSPFARYHSLVGDLGTLPDCLTVTATSLDTGEVMAIQHKTHPTFGVQFHPESVLSQSGYRILANFLGAAGIIDGTFSTDQLPASDLQTTDEAVPNATALHYQRPTAPTAVLPTRPRTQPPTTTS